MLVTVQTSKFTTMLLWTRVSTWENRKKKILLYIMDRKNCCTTACERKSSDCKKLHDVFWNFQGLFFFFWTRTSIFVSWGTSCNLEDNIDPNSRVFRPLWSKSIEGQVWVFIDEFLDYTCKNYKKCSNKFSTFLTGFLLG